MSILKPALTSLPVWVRFSRIPLDLWNSEGLSMVASYLGTPHFADRSTSEQLRLDYARVCIEVEIELKLFDNVPLKYEGKGMIQQEVIYEWFSRKCMKCKQFGHLEASWKVVRAYVRKQQVERSGNGKRKEKVTPECETSCSQSGSTTVNVVITTELEGNVQIGGHNVLVSRGKVMAEEGQSDAGSSGVKGKVDIPHKFNEGTKRLHASRRRRRVKCRELGRRS